MEMDLRHIITYRDLKEVSDLSARYMENFVINATEYV